MSMDYKMITIFTSEDRTWNGKPLYEAVLNYIKGLRTAARCTVWRGLAGCYENGEIATQKLLELSYNMPLKIEIIIPGSEAEAVLTSLDPMITDGIVAVNDLNIRSFKSSKRLVPGYLKVKEVMTSSPKTASLDTPVREIADLLLASAFKGIPVMDPNHHVAGIITQQDLIQKGNMPMRLGLLARLEPGQRKELLKPNSSQKAREIMTHPVITIKEEQHLSEAVRLMVQRKLKRIPVINEQGTLVGMLSRVDIFHSMTQSAPGWAHLEERNIVITNNTSVKEIMTREMNTVKPETPISEVIEKICSDDIQRAAVVDNQGRFLGLISDFDLLPFISNYPLTIWDLFVSKLTFSEAGRKNKELVDHLKAKTAAEIMQKNIITILEDATADEAVQLMTEKELKRLPVIDNNGNFKGMISRDSVLRALIKDEG
ncbi:MAG TPA: histidine kinase [Firmicutes bacterium]|jgi:CBS domain-containing protein|nr:histidine kinase [Bacillota bacterium]